MRRLAVPLALVLALAAGEALACSCPPPNPKRTAAAVELLFDGTVIDQRLGTDLAGREAALIRVRVDKMIRGHRPPSGVLTLHTTPHPSMCGVDYRGGFVGRFGAVMHTGGLYTSSCTQFDLNLERYRR